VPLGVEILLEPGHKRGVPPENRCFTVINSSRVRTVADRHRLAAYYNKHCWRAFRGYQHRWPSMTFKSVRMRKGFPVEVIACVYIETFQQPALKCFKLEKFNFKMYMADLNHTISH